ncbi:MAG: glycosyltransferase family 4 protein, partial [Candidatus Thermoplasmatota archaeon]
EVSKELLKRGHEVTIFTSDIYTEVPWERREEWNDDELGINVKRFPALRKELLFFRSPKIPAMLPSLIGSDCELYHAHSHRYHHLFLSARAHKITKKPLIVTPHYHPYERNVNLLKKAFMALQDFYFGAKVYRNANRIICLTDFEEKIMSRFAPANKCVIVPNGISMEEWQDIPDSTLFRNKYNINDRYILYAGRLASNKGLDFLIRTAARVDEECKFILLGKDWGEKEKLINLTKKLKIESKIIFIDYIDDFEIYKSAINGCEIFILPSEWEAFGIVLLEAMICKKPVIGTNVGGIPGVIKDSETGYIVNYGDINELSKKIKHLLTDKELRKKIGEKGRAVVLENFLWNKVVDKIEKIYKETLEHYNFY